MHLIWVSHSSEFVLTCMEFLMASLNSGETFQLLEYQIVRLGEPKSNQRVGGKNRQQANLPHAASALRPSSLASCGNSNELWVGFEI